MFGVPLADPTPTDGRWASRPPSPEPHAIATLIRDGLLDAELAATLWMLVESRVPLVVASDEAGDGPGSALIAARDLLAPGMGVRVLEGEAETFDWLPQASELGWSSATRVPVDGRGGPPIRPDTTTIVIPDLSDASPTSTWGLRARIAIRAASLGYGLLAAMRADGLEAVLDSLRGAPVSLTDDELSRLGAVLILRRTSDGRLRVVAAHYVRPTSRDVHGHVQRLGPAVLATWDASLGEFEHFAWAIAPELGARIGQPAGDVEIETERRRAVLADLAAGRPSGTAMAAEPVAR